MKNAIILQQIDQQIVAQITSIPARLATTYCQDLNVTVDIDWSSINYKDALAITGKGKIIRQFPMIPGIDFAGHVAKSDDPRFKIGDQVILTGWGVGENYCGGLAQQAQVKGDWLVPLPSQLSLRQAMCIGTAGLTAMLCVMALEEGGILPSCGEIAVTGATGGVGSTSIQILAQLGYSITAITSRLEYKTYLETLGAKNVLNHADFSKTPRPLDKQLWSGAIDTLGGPMLATLLSQTHYNGTIAACGLAQDYQLPTTVMPFILRNVRLQGIDSVYAPLERRQIAWQRLTELLPKAFYQNTCQEIGLEQVVQCAHDLLAHKQHGRLIVNPNI